MAFAERRHPLIGVLQLPAAPARVTFQCYANRGVNSTVNRQQMLTIGYGWAAQLWTIRQLRKKTMNISWIQEVSRSASGSIIWKNQIETEIMVFRLLCRFTNSHHAKSDSSKLHGSTWLHTTCVNVRRSRAILCAECTFIGNGQWTWTSLWVSSIALWSNTDNIYD